MAQGFEDAVVDVIQEQTHADALRKRHACGKGVANNGLKNHALKAWLWLMRGAAKRRHKGKIEAASFFPLSSVGFYNLKAFGNWQTLPIRRLNLIFGKNSSGKSSIFHSLLWIRQVLLNKNLNIMTPERSGDFVDLGGLEQFVHFNKKKETKIGFNLSVEVPRDYLVSPTGELGFRFMQVSEVQSHEDILATKKREECLSSLFQALTPDNKNLTLTLEVVFDLKNIFKQQDNRFRAINVQPCIALSLGNAELISFSPITVAAKQNNPQLGEVGPSSHRVTVSSKIIELLKPVVEAVSRHYGIKQTKGEKAKAPDPKEIEKNLAVAMTLTSIAPQDRGLEIFPAHRSMYPATMLRRSDYCDKTCPEYLAQPPQKQINEMYRMEYGMLAENISNIIWRAALGFFHEPNYLAAYRNYPEREISQRGLLKLRQQDPYGNESYRDIFENQEFLHRINKACDTLNADFRFVVDRQSSRSAGLRLEIKNRRSGLPLSFRDIGFGWSQVLPVIVEIVQGMHSALLVEQPELHLHPSNQSQLMDVVLDNLGSPKHTAAPILLELHSEQMVLRLLRRIKESGSVSGRKKVSPRDCSIVYVKKDNAGSVITTLEISEEGTMVDTWPGGFFESALKDL